MASSSFGRTAERSFDVKEAPTFHPFEIERVANAFERDVRDRENRVRRGYRGKRSGHEPRERLP